MNIDTKRLKTYCISNRGIISFLWCRSILVSPKSVVFWNIFAWWCNVWPRAFLPQDRKEIAVHTFRVRQRQDGHPVICVLHSEIWEDNFLKLCCHSSVINVFQLVLCVMSLLLFLLFFFFFKPSALSCSAFGAGPSGECVSVLCSSKHPECEHIPAQLQPTDIRQTGALHGWPRKQMYFQLTREQLYLSKWFLPSGGCIQWKTQRNVNPLKQSTWSCFFPHIVAFLKCLICVAGTL